MDLDSSYAMAQPARKTAQTSFFLHEKTNSARNEKRKMVVSKSNTLYPSNEPANETAPSFHTTQAKSRNYNAQSLPIKVVTNISKAKPGSSERDGIKSLLARGSQQAKGLVHLKQQMQDAGDRGADEVGLLKRFSGIMDGKGKVENADLL